MASPRWVVWVRNIALAGVIVAFIAFFGLPSGTAPVAVVAEVDGEMIQRDIFEFFREQNAARLAGVSPPGADEAALRDLIDRQTLESVLYRYLMSQEARALGLRVTDAEVRQEILSNPGFRGEDGRFDRELFERFVARNDLGSERVYTEELRRDLLLRKFQRLITSPVRVAEARVREDVGRLLAEVSLRYVAVEVPAPAPDALEEAEVAAFLEREQTRVQGLYQSRIQQYRQPEQVRARHILFVGADGLERAQSARARLEGGESFEALARELSDDEATRDQGGSLGSFPRGRMAPALEQAAFALEPGSFSQPIETSRGHHLILVEERIEAVERTLEAVGPELARELLAGDRARAEARERAESLAGELRAGRDFAEVATREGLEVQTSPFFGYAAPPPSDLANVAGLREEAFSLSAASPVSTRVLEAGDRLLVIALAERREPSADELALRVEQARDQAEIRARGEVMSRWYSLRRAELERDGRLRIYAVYPEG